MRASAFSDMELLDALTDMGEEPMDFGMFNKPFLVTGDVVDSSFGAGPFSVASTSANDRVTHALAMDADESTSADSSSDLFESESLTADASSPTTVAKPKRKRRKHELDAVRALANSLENQLDSLKKRHHPEHPGANLFWKRVADQLLLDRQRATTENARLRDIFQDQAKVLKAIQKSIQKSPDLEKLGVAPAPVSPPDTLSSSDIYSRLFQDVTNSYAGTDTVLEQAGVRRTTDTKRKVNVNMTTEDGRSALTMEVAESRILPFHVLQVAESAWSFLTRTGGCKNMTGCCTGVQSDEVFRRTFKARGNDVFGVCKIDCSLGLYTLNGDVAIRRFIEGDRITYVWECAGRCDNEPNPFSSFRVQEKGWCVFEPSSVDPLGKSIFRTCVQFIPLPLDPSQELGTAAKEVGLVTEVGLSIYERTIDYIFTNVVSELKDRASISGA